MITGIIIGILITYIYHRIKRSMWVELGRVQSKCLSGKVKPVIKDSKYGETLYLENQDTLGGTTYCESSSKFLIKQLKKYGTIK